MTDRSRELRDTPNIDEMTHRQIVDELMHFERAVRMDFTPEFVAEQTLGQLQHILAAARMHISLKPIVGSQPQYGEPQASAHAD